MHGTWKLWCKSRNVAIIVLLSPAQSLKMFLNRSGFKLSKAVACAINSDTSKRSKYTLVLVRHGESSWNKENKFTGWYVSEQVNDIGQCRHPSPKVIEMSMKATAFHFSDNESPVSIELFVLWAKRSCAERLIQYQIVRYDCPLSEAGNIEAAAAGALLKKEGSFPFHHQHA